MKLFTFVFYKYDAFCVVLEKMGCCIVKRSFSAGGVGGGVTKKKCTPRTKKVGGGKRLDLNELAYDLQKKVEGCSDNENWEFQIAVCEELGTNARPGRWALSVRVAEMVDWYPHVRERLDKKDLNLRREEQKLNSKQ